MKAISNIINPEASLLSMMSPKGDAFREIKKLKRRKDTQIYPFPVKILNQNPDIFTANICNFISFCVSQSKLPNIFK